MKKTKRWLALLLAGLLTVPNVGVYAEELTDGATVEEIVSEELPEVGTNVIEVPEPLEIKNIVVSPEHGTFMRTGDTYSMSFQISGTNTIPKNSFIHWKASFIDENGQGTLGPAIYFNLPAETGNIEVWNIESDPGWFDLNTVEIHFDKPSMTVSFSAKIKKSKFYYFRTYSAWVDMPDGTNIMGYADYESELFVDDDCADGIHTVFSNQEPTVDKEPTCTEPGSKSKHCIKCNSIIEDTIEEVPALGHKWNEKYTIDREPTSTERGQKSIHCSVCDAIKEGSVVEYGEIADINDSVVYGLEEPLQLTPGTFYEFSVVGAGTDNENPGEGDTRWVPVYWRMKTGTTKQKNWQIGAAKGIADEREIPLLIFLQEQKYTNGAWVATGIEGSIEAVVKTKAWEEITPTPTPIIPEPTTVPTTEIIYYYITPTPIPVDHEAYIPPIEECSVSGLEEARVYAPGKYFGFEGVGVSAETKYSVRTISDGMWIPAYWSFDEAGKDRDTRFKLGHDDGISAGTHDLYVWFRLFKWDGEDWVATSKVESIKTQFVAEEAPKPTPTPDPEPAVTSPKTVITKLEDTGSGNLRIYWRSMEDKVDGYQIRWATNKEMTGVKTATYTGINNTTRPGLSVGSIYYVGIRTFVMHDGKKVYSEWSGTKALKLTRTLATPSVSGASQKGTGIQTKWFTVADAEGYQLRFCQDPSFKGARTASVIGQNKTSFTKYGLGSGTWYVAVRAYKTAEDGVRYYSAWSGTQTVELK